MSLQSTIYLKEIPTDIDPKYVTDGRVFIDCPDDFVTILSKKVSKFRNFSSSLGNDAVLGFTLPDSPKNDWLFDKLLDARIANNNFNYLEVWVHNGGDLVPVTRLFVRRRNNNGSYEVELRRGQEHWVEQIKQLKLNEIQYGNFEFTIGNFQTNRNKTTYADGDEGYLFADVDYGGLEGKNSVPIGYLRPLFFPLDMIRRGLGQLGWNFRSSFLESTRARSMVTYVNAFEIGVNEAAVRRRKFRGMNTERFDNTVGNDPEDERDIGLWKLRWTIDEDPSGSYVAGSGEIENNSVGSWRLYGTFDGERYNYGSNNTSNNSVVFKVYKSHADGRDELIGEISKFIDSSAAGTPNQFNVNLLINDVSLSDGETIYVEIEVGANTIADFSTGNGLYFENTPIRTIYQVGDIEQINNYLNGDYTLFDYMEGIFHLTAKGYIYTDWNTRTVYHFPPYGVTWYGEFIEGFYLENGTPENMVEKAQLGTQIIENKRADGDRFISLRFADSSDDAIKARNYPKEEPPYSLLIDRGTDFRNKTKKEQNPFFQPTIQGEILLDNPLQVTPLPIAVMRDNDENELSFEIAPRILFTNPYQTIRKSTGEQAQFVFHRTVISSAYVYQVANAINDDGSAIADQLVYGGHPESLYQSFWRRILTVSLYGFKISGLYKYTHDEYKSTPFRKQYQISYNQKEVAARLEEINRHDPNKGYNTELIFTPEVLRDESFFNTYLTPSDNDFNVVFTTNNQCQVAATFNDTFSDTFQSEISEYSLDDGVTWIPYTGNFITPTVNTIVFRRTVFLLDSNGVQIQVVRSKAFYKENLCNDRVNIWIQTVRNNKVISARARDVLTNVIDTDIWEVSFNGSAFMPYLPNDQYPFFAGFTDIITFRRTVTFVGGFCPLQQITRTYTYNGDTVNNCRHEGLGARIGGSSSAVFFEPESTSVVDNVNAVFIYWKQSGATEWNLYTGGTFNYGTTVPIEFYTVWFFENCPTVRTGIQTNVTVPII